MLNPTAKRELDAWLDGNQVCDECYATLYAIVLRFPPSMPFKPVNQRIGECAACRRAL